MCLTPLNDTSTAPLLRPQQGILMSWDSETVFAVSMLGYHARSRSPATFALQMTPTPREHNRHVPPVMMATPWTVGMNVFAYDAGNRDKSTAQGPRKLPENLPKLALNGDSYDFAMEMARALQAQCYNLDEWGAKAILLLVDQRYADAMTHALQRDLRPTWKEIIRTLLRYALVRLTTVEAGRHLEIMRMDIYEPILCYLQKFEKFRMLSGMRRNAREVCTHFLSGLDCEVCIMFTGRFPTWLEDGKINEGYAYMSELQETFNMVTQNIAQYVKFHQAMDKAISAKYGALTLNRPSPVSASATMPRATGGDSYPCTGTTAASGACTDSRRSLGGGRDQCHWPRNNEQQDRGAYGYRGNVPPGNVRRTEVDDDPTAAENEEAEVDARADTDWPSEASWPEDGPTAQRVDIFGKFSGDDDLDLEVRMALVKTARGPVPPVASDNMHPQLMQGTVRGGPAADRALLELWHIPVRTSAGSLTVATWVELDSGASHMLISKSIIQQLKPTTMLKGGTIHLAMTSASIKRVGCFKLTLCTSRHMILVCADVLPGECGSPTLIGRDVLAQYCIDDLLSVLMDWDGEQLATLTEPDVMELAAADDSSHWMDMLAALVTKLRANMSLDKLLA
ncbi:hypothetical protein H4S08_004507 [Coemansia sp. RSA 1365]|nr:hypothetical protein H4S08_004507 [Coemansia sp. RSA 1365]